MAWQTRNGRKYYYRSQRVDGRVRSIYVGSGAKGFLSALDVALTMKDRDQQRTVLNDLRAQNGQSAALLRELNRQMQLLTHGVLLVAGYYCHNRSEWRVRHGKHRTARKQ